MSHTHTWRRFFHGFCALFCLVLLLSACNQLSRGEPPSTYLPGKKATSTPGQACPARGTARAALMPPLPAGLNPQLVYVFQQGDTSILQRYDVNTGSQETILQTQAPGIYKYSLDNVGERIADANVSPDGQWVLLKSVVQGQAAIQLVRVDGQHFQTLYCAPAQAGIDDALLSPDQRSLVFNQEDVNALSTLYVLDLTTGKLHIALSPLQPNYPEIAQGQQQTTLMAAYAPISSRERTTGNLNTPLFNPLPSKHYLIYVPMKWVNNNSVYVFGMVRASGAPLHTLALLRDIRK